MPKQLFFIGPCAAETKIQVLETARALVSRLGTSFVFRAGLWKPRTTPGHFEGVGAEGLEWLCEVRETMGLSVATEVATPEHLRLALEAGIDYLWIGARTTTNPFLVQALADEYTKLSPSTFDFRLSTLDSRPSTFLVKNPVSPDVNLWQGAIERLRQAGIEHIIAVHRGFAPGTSELRNAPCWSEPIELKRRIPDLPIILDPSHMAGCRERIPILSQQAMDMGYHGLMIESHISPDDALSDAIQQLTPSDVAELLSHLQLRQTSTSDTLLTALRQQIDEADDAIWQAILKRQQVSRQIGDLKRQAGIPVLQEGRFNAILNKRIDWAKKQGLSEELVRSIMQAIHTASVNTQL